MKKIIIAGGSGLIGTYLTSYFSSKDYQVLSISRSNANNAITWDSDLSQYISGADCIINLAGASIGGSRWTDEYKKIVVSSRIDATSKLVDAINSAQQKPKLLINASAIGYYGDRRDEVLDEASQCGSGFLADVCSQWEDSLDGISPETRLVVARIGIVLSARGGALEKMAAPVKMLAGGKLGSGKQWMSWIHIHDVARLIDFIIENKEVAGAVNFVSPEPIRNSDFTRELGKVLNRPIWAPVPEFALSLILGESKEMVLSSQRVVPKSAINHGFEFIHSDLNKALTDLLIK
jgi:uncharacterized protein (TIGR01777 family)